MKPTFRDTVLQILSDTCIGIFYLFENQSLKKEKYILRNCHKTTFASIFITHQVNTYNLEGNIEQLLRYSEII